MAEPRKSRSRTAPGPASAEPRAPLSRERVLQAAVELADEHGIDAVSMRRVARELGVEAMSLYNHVDNKEDILTGMVDLVVAQMSVAEGGADWRTGMRQTILGAREVLMAHPWAPRVIESRTDLTPAMLQHFDGVVGILLRAGFSPDLTHHAVHTLGSRALGFSQELFDDSQIPDDPVMAALMVQQIAAAYPNLGAMISAGAHEDEDNALLGGGCDSQWEFEFTLDLVIDGLERLRLAEETQPPRDEGAPLGRPRRLRAEHDAPPG